MVRGDRDDKALSESIPFVGAILVGILGGTASRWLIDVAAGVPPFHLMHGASFVGSAVVGSAVVIAILYIIADQALGLTIWPATLIAVAVGTVVRLGAIRRGWDAPART